MKKWIWSLEKKETKKVIKKTENHSNISNTTCNIKWNISSKWVKIYHYPWCGSYKRTKISLDKWEKYFCSNKEAENAGWRVAWNCN
jgi:hypothetical protein